MVGLYSCLQVTDSYSVTDCTSEQLGEEVGKPNFGLSSYGHDNGREQPMYTMDEETNPTLDSVNTVWRYPTLDSVNTPLLTVSIKAFKSNVWYDVYRGGDNNG